MMTGVRSTEAGWTDNEYRYDGLGSRVSTLESKGFRYYDWDSINILQEKTDGGTVTDRQVHGSSPIASVGDIAHIESPGDAYVPTADAMGTIWNLIDASADKVNAYGYDAFGVPRETVESFANSYRFVGKRFDPDSTLSHFSATQYSAPAGRSVSDGLLVSLAISSPRAAAQSVERLGNVGDVAGVRNAYLGTSESLDLATVDATQSTSDALSGTEHAFAAAGAGKQLIRPIQRPRVKKGSKKYCCLEWATGTELLGFGPLFTEQNCIDMMNSQFAGKYYYAAGATLGIGVILIFCGAAVPGVVAASGAASVIVDFHILAAAYCRTEWCTNREVPATRLEWRWYTPVPLIVEFCPRGDLYTQKLFPRLPGVVHLF